ncbi:MAG: hypothetical protein ABW172_06355 [Candidatus Binatia bacterium]|jgi:heme-degrading monooxygenase HmoA
MYTRNVRLKLKANGAQEFTRILEKEIIPLLRKQEGFQDEMLLVDPQRNEVIAISFWDKQVNAEVYNHIAYLDVLRILSKVVEEMPIVETYEVANSTAHEIAVSAA